MKPQTSDVFHGSSNPLRESARIDSSKFKKPNHDNPDSMPYADKSWNAADATIGAFKLNDVVLEVLSPTKPIVPEAAALDTINKQSKANAGTKASISSEMIYLSDPKNPNIGDVRIGYAALPSGPLSVVARQIKDTFEPYKAKSGDVLLVQTGSASADAMFKQAEEENAQMTWIIRIAGFVVILIGFSLFFAPLATIADVVPLIGSIIGAGTFVAAFIITIPVWFTTVAIAWVVYRPLIGIALLVVAIGVPVAFMVLRKPPQKMQPANS